MTSSGSADGRTTRWQSATRDLNLRIKWRFAFVALGTVAEPSPDTIYLDVGGRFVAGVIDHHQGGGKACSATRLVFDRPDFVYDHLVGPWHEALRLRSVEGARGSIEWSPTIVLHTAPDFDAIAAAHLAMCIVESGDLPRYARALADYADRVDQGLEQLTVGESNSSLYPLILMLSNLGDDDLLASFRAFNLENVSKDLGIVRAGIQLMSAWGSADSPAPNSLIGDDCPGASLLAELLHKDREKFSALVEAGKVVRLDGIRVPFATGPSVEGVHASAIPKFEICACNKLYLRAYGVTGVGTPLTVIHGWRHGRASDSLLRHWIIAVEPSRGATASRTSLRGLGASLELAEQRKRGDSDRSRHGLTRFVEFPDIEDPWYDGRGHDMTIVDSPKAGSRLSYEEVCVVLRTAYWEPEVASGATINASTESGEVLECYRADELVRLDVLRTKLMDKRKAHESELELIAVVQAELSTAWGPEAISEFARAVVGGDLNGVPFRGGIAYVGARGVFVNLAKGQGSDAEVNVAFGRLLAILATLRAADEALKGGADKDASGCRDLRMNHVKAVAKYFSTRGAYKSVEMVELAERLGNAVGVDVRVRGVSDLLQHLDDESQRIQNTRIGRLLFLVGCFGVLQTFTAFFDYFDSGWDGDGSNPLQILFASLLVVVGLVVAAFAVLTLSTRCARLFRGIPKLGPLLFDDVSTESTHRTEQGG